MANVITGKNWTIDTAGASAIWPTRVYVKGIYWKGPTTIGHTCIIKDSVGRIIKSLVCEVALQSQFFLIETWFDGLAVTTLASGTLEIGIC